jgi:enamine deaminase RidA (YjgF/YER057c/UK114 family)
MKQEILQFESDEVGFSISETVEDVIHKLAKVEFDTNLQRAIISLAFFIDAEKQDFYMIRGKIISKLKKIYTNPPAFSIIGQVPASKASLQLDANIVLYTPGECTIQYSSVNEDIFFTTIETSSFCEYYFSGITVADNYFSNIDMIGGAYRLMNNALLSLGLGMNNIVRQWNYLEDILKINQSDNEMNQNYQVLNNIRHEFYKNFTFSNGYPAATGIGMSSGGFVLECIAIKEKEKINITPIKNPAQISAYEYSKKVLIGGQSQDLSTPLFERAKIYAKGATQYVLFVSGTAAIHNEQSLAKGDAEVQTIITINNIDKLIESGTHKVEEFQKQVKNTSLNYLRVYIKNKDDINKVKAICDKYTGSVKPVYLIADICRNELLVEIEGIVDIYAE